MREKYIDVHAGGLWFIFGECEDGTVDLSNGVDLVFTGLPLEQALRVQDIRYAFLEALYKELKLN